LNVTELRPDLVTCGRCGAPSVADVHLAVYPLRKGPVKPLTPETLGTFEPMHSLLQVSSVACRACANEAGQLLLAFFQGKQPGAP
jgi:hypothetical protein